ncbi:unnamed protein product, partial [Effrenium voratum]
AAVVLRRAHADAWKYQELATHLDCAWGAGWYRSYRAQRGLPAPAEPQGGPAPLRPPGARARWQAHLRGGSRGARGLRLRRRPGVARDHLGPRRPGHRFRRRGAEEAEKGGRRCARCAGLLWVKSRAAIKSRA